MTGNIDNAFIVVFKDAAGASSQAWGDTLVSWNPNIQVTATYNLAINGFSAKMTVEEAEAMANSDLVSYIEQDGMVYADQLDTWALDRIDQRDLPLDSTYSPFGRGSGVTAYILDSGIRITHEEFDGGRASWGINTSGDGRDEDCNGHGTHVAGTVAGKKYGVANAANVVAVKVLNCGGGGTYSGVINGVEWVMNNAKKPATANMSLWRR